MPKLTEITTYDDVMRSFFVGQPSGPCLMVTATA